MIKHLVLKRLIFISISVFTLMIGSFQSGHTLDFLKTLAGSVGQNIQSNVENKMQGTGCSMIVRTLGQDPQMIVNNISNNPSLYSRFINACNPSQSNMMPPPIQEAYLVVFKGRLLSILRGNGQSIAPNEIPMHLKQSYQGNTDYIVTTMAQIVARENGCPNSLMTKTQDPNGGGMVYVLRPPPLFLSSAPVQILMNGQSMKAQQVLGINSAQLMMNDQVMSMVQLVAVNGQIVPVQQTNGQWQAVILQMGQMLLLSLGNGQQKQLSVGKTSTGQMGLARQTPQGLMPLQLTSMNGQSVLDL